jgi:hypothetical protein
MRSRPLDVFEFESRGLEVFASPHEVIYPIMERIRAGKLARFVTEERVVLDPSIQRVLNHHDTLDRAAQREAFFHSPKLP